MVIDVANKVLLLNSRPINSFFTCNPRYKNVKKPDTKGNLAKELNKHLLQQAFFPLFRLFNLLGDDMNFLVNRGEKIGDFGLFL